MAQPTLTAKPAKGLQDTAIPLAIDVGAGDPKDTLAIWMGPLPEGSALTAGSADATRRWSLAKNELAGLRFVPAPGAFGFVALGVQVDEIDAAGQTSSASATLDVEVTASDAALREKLKEVFVPAARWQRWLTGVLLIFGSVVIVWLWFHYIDRAQDLAVKEYSVAWEQPEGTLLASDRPSFWYDRANKVLRHRGAIDAERKEDLLGLLTLAAEPPAGIPADEVGSMPQSGGEIAECGLSVIWGWLVAGGSAQPTDGGSETEPPADSSGGTETQPDDQLSEDERLLDFRTAIDALTYQSLSDAGLYFMLLLIVAGLSGAVGVQVRATLNFVRICCVHNLLDIRRWWPWYLLRPPLGFILGVLIVLLVQSEIFTPEGTSTPEGTTWWIAIAFLVGFGAEDFSERLRLLSQTLFGKEG
jgi:hypothetical protein